MSGLSAGNGFAFGSGSASSIAVGTTAISGGSTGRLLYDNGGVIGESSGVSTDGTSLNITTNLSLSATSIFNFTSRSRITSPANGNLALFNQAQTDFGLLQFGGVTAAFPAIKRSGTGLIVRLADDSANADLNVANLTASVNVVVPSGGRVIWAAGSRFFANTDGNIMMTNAAGTAFNMLQFGGGTNLFVALKSVAQTMQLRLADDTGFANLRAKLTTDTAYAAGVITPTGSLTIYDASGTAYKVACSL